MSDFPNPHRDEAAEDPFLAPAPELENAEMGASPVNPITAARAPKKRMAAILIAVAVVALVIFFAVTLRSSSSDTPAPSAAPVHQGTVDSAVSAAPSPDAPPASQPADPIAQQPVTPTATGPEAGIDPNQFTAPGTPTGATNTPPGVQPGAVPPGIPAGIPGAVPSVPATQYQPIPGSPAAGASADDSATVLARQAALDRQRELDQERQARAAAALEVQKNEEARLKGAATMVAENQSVNAAESRNAGTSRFGLGALTRRAGAPSAATGTTAPGAAAGTETGADAPLGAALSAATPQAADPEAYNLLPGTRVRAVTATEFISDAQGGGQIEVRLTQPLRAKDGTIVLPAGTRAYGSANSNGAQTGQAARVAITVNVFVTPRGDVIRDLAGKAADPQTLAMSVAAKADYRYMSRVMRGALSTAVDLAIASHEEPQQACGLAGCPPPSPKNEAINNARQRAATMINGPIGDENSVQAAVRLPANTPIVLIFGI